MEYTIIVRETLEKQIKIKAATEREALDLVRDDYENGGIVLDSSNHTSTEYVDEKGKVIAVWM